jgi:hypothetical protein
VLVMENKLDHPQSRTRPRSSGKQGTHQLVEM